MSKELEDDWAFLRGPVEPASVPETPRLCPEPAWSKDSRLIVEERRLLEDGHILYQVRCCYCQSVWYRRVDGWINHSGEDCSINQQIHRLFR